MKKIAVGLVACWALLQAGAEELQWLTGSDWCPPCKALRKNVLSSEAFLEYAKKNLVPVDVDFPRHTSQAEDLKKANEALSEKFSVRAFPTIVVLDSDGKQLKKTEGYDGGNAKDFIADLEKLKKKT